MGVKMETIGKHGGGAPAAGGVGMGAPSGPDEPFVTISKELLVNFYSHGLFYEIAGYIPGELTAVSRGLTVIDPNAKLGMLRKVQRLDVFSYLQGELPQNINTKNLDFESIRLINSLFKRVCADTASFYSIIFNRESSIQDVYGIVQGPNTNHITWVQESNAP
jgi:hypothetical protein